MVILSQNVIVHMMFSYFLNLFKELHKQALELSSRRELWWIVPNSTGMTVAAIFKSRVLNFKNGRCRKKSHIFVIYLKLQVRLRMQSLSRYLVFTSHGIKKSNFLKKKKNQGMRLKLSSALLRRLSESLTLPGLAYLVQILTWLHVSDYRNLEHWKMVVYKLIVKH